MKRIVTSNTRALWLWPAVLSMSFWFMTPLGALAQNDTVGDIHGASSHAPALNDPEPESPPASPTRVAIAVKLLTLDRVSEAADPDPTFDGSYWMELRWTDPRLAFAGQQSKHFVEENAQVELEKIWQPDVAPENEEGSRETATASLTIGPDGAVTYEEKFKTRTAARFDLRAFPFDRQHLSLVMVSGWDDRGVIFEPMPTEPSPREIIHPSEWRLDPPATRTERRVEDDGSFGSAFVFDIQARRQGTYYLFKLILPLVVVVMLSWSNFWITGKGDGRIRLTFICLLAVIAYQSVLSRFLPRLTVLTFMDWVIILSLASLAVTVVENAWVHQLLQRNKTAEADRIDFWARRVIPVAVIMGIAVSGLVHLV